MTQPKFKVGDRLRRISNFTEYMPKGHEATVFFNRTYNSAMVKNNRDEAAFVIDDRWELVQAAFDPTKLRIDDEVLVKLVVNSNGVDSDGDIHLKDGPYETATIYVTPDHIISFAPGFKRGITAEEALEYAKAHEEEVRKFLDERSS